MINRKVIEGAWYCDARPTGEHVAAIFEAQRVRTHGGEIPTGHDLLYVRCNQLLSNPFKFAGQDQRGGGNYEADLSGDPPTRVGGSFGVSPVIYDQSDKLVQASLSHQGYRFVRPNGSLATGDETYSDPANSLAEFTDLGNIRVGQGHEGGAIVVIDGQRRLLEAGHCTFIRAAFSRGVYSFAIVKLLEKRAVIIWATRDELEKLPLAPIAVPAPPPVPPQPQPQPQPTEPKPMPTPDRLETVQTIRAKYPTPLGDKHAQFLVEVAKAVGGKLFRKPSGDHTTLPDGTPVSLDVVIVPPDWVDVLGDAERSAVPAWSVHPNAGEPEKWVDVSGVTFPSPSSTAPAPPQPSPSPSPAPAPPSPPSFDPGPLQAALGALNARVTDLERTIQAAQLDSALLGSRLNRLVNALLAPRSTSRAYAHAHSFTPLNEDPTK